MTPSRTVLTEAVPTAARANPETFGMWLCKLIGKILLFAIAVFAAVLIASHQQDRPHFVGKPRTYVTAPNDTLQKIAKYAVSCPTGDLQDVVNKITALNPRLHLAAVVPVGATIKIPRCK